MKKRKNLEIKIIYTVIVLLFLVFLAIPFVNLLKQAFLGDGSFTIGYFKSVLT